MTTTPTLTIAQFLADRIADTIANAREVQALAVTRGIQPDDPREPSLRLAQFVLAECAALREVLEIHDQSGLRWIGHPRATEQVPYCHADQERSPCTTLRALASVYAGHEGWRDEWAM